MTLEFQIIPPLPPSIDKSHHLPNSVGFRNPWPSFKPHEGGALTIFKTRFSPSRPAFVPVPEDRNELVPVQHPDFTPPQPSTDGKATMKVTWLGHASFLIQCSASLSQSAFDAHTTSRPSSRGINMLLDPVFSERTSPLTFLGPKRYTPTPCTLIELCDNVPIDVICISHNHYDHADVTTLRYVFERAAKEDREMVVCAPSGNERWLKPLVPGGEQVRIRVWEGDWWERIEVVMNSSPASGEQDVDSLNGQITSGHGNSITSTSGVSEQKTEADTVSSSIRITITPSQHTTARSVFDKDKDLWSSFAIEVPPFTTSQPHSSSQPISNPSLEVLDEKGVNVYFSGDTAYRTTFPHPGTPNVESLTTIQRQSYPSNPSFAQIGELLGPFSLALLPIGLTKPRSFMSSIHADSWDSVCIHRDIKAKRSVGMHWGTVRGGLSGQYEDVRDPPREWRRAAEEEGLRWRGKARNDGDADVGGLGTGAREDGLDGEGEKDDWDVGLMDVGESLII